MFVEQPPWLYRLLFPGAVWRVKESRRKVVYLTFDDGPVPEVTPWVLETLARYGVRATFFMVGDNVRRNPGLLRQVHAAGHSVGNHTMHHLQGLHTSTRRYLRDISEASALIGSRLFRPPHGIMRRGQLRALRRRFDIIMYDVVTRDYSSKLTAARVLRNLRRYTRPGSIIVFHDSIKAQPRMQAVLPAAIEWLLEQGYTFEILPER
ncbi:MAG: polysaccharide deacetylase family protein [Muribaculaceae bacterium]|nr:polysaccharide deacetylase family protein [Muribaculaceae bacterium]